MPGSKGKEDEAEDETWEPPKLPKPKPKNFALLQAKKKKWEKKGKATKTVLRCQFCSVTCYDQQQLKDHERSHGSCMKLIKAYVIASLV
jgi:hypothetical protein